MRKVSNWLGCGFATLAIAGTALMVGCEKKEKPEVGQVVVTVPTESVYEVRGEIVDMPEDQKSIKLKHEAIPNFANKRGEVVGMKSMVMPFPLGKGVEMGELKQGDKVKATFVVTWQENPYYITSLEPLPSETELDYSNHSMKKHDADEHAEHQMGEHKGEHDADQDHDHSHEAHDDHDAH